MNLKSLNQNGQAIIEALPVLSLIVFSTIFVLGVFFNMTLSIAIDDAIETYFFCQLQKKTSCKQDLRNGLNTLHLKNISLQFNNQPPNYNVTLAAKTSFKYEVFKQRELYFKSDDFLY